MQEHTNERASIQAVYAVFGPRSAFTGKVVMSDPPLADQVPVPTNTLLTVCILCAVSVSDLAR